MARIVPNNFTTYALEDVEVRSGNILSETQKYVRRNLLAEKMNERINLTLDLNNPGAYAQQEAYLKGQIDMISYMLELSDAEEEAIKTEASLDSTHM